MTFERRGVREMAAAREARDPGAVLTGGVGAAAIGQTLVPNNMPPERFGDVSDYARAQVRFQGPALVFVWRHGWPVNELKGLL